MPILWKENQPSTTRSRFIIVAKTGRRMHTAARPTPPLVARALGGLGAGAIRLLHAHLGAVIKLRLAGHDDDFSTLEPGKDLLLIVEDAPDLHFARLDG